MVAEVRYDIRADDVVGARKSGLLCVPAGKLHWNMVSPDRRGLTDRLSAAMRAAGLDAKLTSEDDFDREVRTPFRISVTVEAAHISACGPWLGLKIGKAARQKVMGEIATTWRVFDQKRRVLVVKAAFCTRFKAESDTDALTEVFLKLASTVAKRVAEAEPLEQQADQGTGGVNSCEVNAV